MWPILYIFLFIAAVMLLVGLSPQDGGGSGESMWLPFSFMGLMAVHTITIFGSLALTVFYIIRIFKTEQIEQNMKIMWTLLMFFAGMLAQPVFWYLYIWREAPAATSATQPALLDPGLETAWGKRTATPKAEAAYIPPRQPPDWR